jgi:hypothetical protein
MAIDGLKNIPGILPVKQERQAGQTPRRNPKQDRNKEQKKDNEEPKEKEGRIDIRI